MMTQLKLTSRTGLLILLIVSTYALSSCSSGDSGLPDAEPVAVNVQTAGEQIPKASLSFPAQVVSNNEANLSTILMGTVTEMRVSIGDVVQKGDLIARIRDEQIRAQKMQLDAQMIQAKANLTNVERNYNRIKNLFEDDSATQKEMDDISTMYESARANVSALEAGLEEVNEMLQYTVIRAPFSGVITQKFVRTGDMAAPGHPLVRLSDPADVKITASIPGQIINQVETGMDVKLNIKAAGEAYVPGRLSNISTAGDPVSRQFAVEARLADSSKAPMLRPGMFAELIIETEARPSLTVPVSALVQRGQLTGLYTINQDNRLVLRWVQTGRKSGDDIEILSGLSSGETYVTEAAPELRQGTIIRIK